MGNMHAAEYAEAVSEGTISLRMALAVHFASNHYPPIDQALVPKAIEAIDLANKGDWETKIELPHGPVSVALLVQGMHLDAFLDDDDDPED